MKQTAVEWLTEKLRIEFGFAFSNNILEQAKEIEKQQMIDFANDLLARNNKNYIALPDLAEQYYNEIYKNK